MWYEDLAKFDLLGAKTARLLCGRNHAEMTIAVGWLENGKLYTTGETPENFVDTLHEFIKTNELYFAFLGVHECDLCNVKLPPGHLNIINGFGSKTCYIAYKDKVYLFPDLIIHYIEDHAYLPPSEFVEAVLNCTPHETIEYFKEIRQNI